MIRIVIPEPSPSLNETKKLHFGALKRLKEHWAMMMLCAGVKREPQATGRRRCTVERHAPRALDVDNLAGGAKECVVDNLRHFGLLVNDSPKHAELVYRNVKSAKGERPHTVVVLENL